MDTENRIDEMDDEAQLKTLLKSFNLEAITENLKCECCIRCFYLNIIILL